MKKYIIVAAATLIAAVSTVSAQDKGNVEPCDTVLNIKDAGKVIVTENPDGVNVEVKGLRDDDEFQTSCSIPYDKNSVIKTHQSYTMPMSLYMSLNQDIIGLMQGLHFGFTEAVDAPAAMDTQMGKSFEIGIDNIIFYGYRFGSKHHRNMISVGMGVNWRNYRMTGMNRFDMDGDNVVVTGYPEGADPKYSRLKVFSLSFPVSYTYYTPVKMLARGVLAFKLSAILNWNSHASMLTGYDLADGTKVKENYDRIGQRKFTVDLQFAVQVAPAVGLYFKYTPMDFFKSSTQSPKFQTISTGITLGF